MPIIAVAGAVLVDAIAVSTLTAASLATVGGALMAIGAVGATIGAIGVVTGNKGLQTAGMIMGGISAVGGLASAVGMIDSSTSLFGSAAAGAGTEAAAGGMSAAEQIASQIPGGSPALTAAAGIPPDIISSLAPSAIPQTTSATDVSVSAAGNVNIPNAASAIDTNVSAAANPANILKYGSQVPISQPNLSIPSSADMLATATPTAVPGVMSGVMDFAKSNPLVTYGLLQTAGSTISGLFNPVTPAQVNAANAQAENNRAQAGLTNQQVANMKSGIPVANLTPVKSAPVTGMPAGMINTSMNAGAVS